MTLRSGMLGVAGLGVSLMVAATFTPVLVTVEADRAEALTGYAYAGAVGTAGGVYGIDGYIRPSTTASLPSPLHRAEWVNLCRNSCDQWVQVGTYQGYLPNSSSPSATHVYVENSWQGCFYDQSDKGGLPTQPNQAYYVTYTGSSQSSVCGSARGYEFAFRRGSLTSSSMSYGFLGSSTGQPISESEIYSNGPAVPINTTYFGVDNSF